MAMVVIITRLTHQTPVYYNPPPPPPPKKKTNDRGWWNVGVQYLPRLVSLFCEQKDV